MPPSASRKARVEITADSSKLGPGINDAKRQLRMLERDQKRAAKEAEREAKHQAKLADARHKDRVKGVKGAAGAVVGGLSAAAGFDLAGGIAGAIGDVLNFEKRLVRFQIVAGKTPGQMMAFRESIAAVSKETAKSREEVLSGAQTYVDLTGDVQGAQAAMRTMARVAQASDSNVGDVATSMAAMRESMKIDPADFEAVFSGLINQGKKGAVNLKDFAGELSSILPQFAEFGVRGKEGVNIMGAMFQIGRKGFGSASETATGMQGLMGGLTKNAKRFAAAGVEIFNVGKNGEKTFKPLSEIVTAIGRSSLAKDPTALTKAFGRKEGMEFYRMLRENVDELRELEAAGLDATVVGKDLETYLNSPSGKMEKAWNNIKLAIAEALTPDRIERFANAMERAAGGAVKVIAVADKIIAATEAGAKALARMIGGKSEDDVQAERLADRQLERRKILANEYNREHPKEAWMALTEGDAGFGDTSMAHQEHIGKYVSERMGEEDLVRDRLYAQTQGQDWTKDEKLARKPSIGDAFMGRTGTYGMSELSDLSSTTKGGSNDAQLAQLLQQAHTGAVAEALTAAVPAITAAIVAAIPSLKVIVQGDSKVLASSISESVGSSVSNSARR